MSFYVTITEDELYHVQNYLMGRAGQHHVHTKEGFETWKGNVSDDDIKILSGKTCDCGLTPSQVREYTGKTWTSDKF